MVIAEDNANINNGPVLNSGYIAIRCMIRAKILFRNLKVYNKNEGILGVGPTSGVMEIIGGTGECTGIEGTLEMLPRPKVKSSKKGTYQGIGIGKISWKIP